MFGLVTLPRKLSVVVYQLSALSRCPREQAFENRTCWVIGCLFYNNNYNTRPKQNMAREHLHSALVEKEYRIYSGLFSYGVYIFRIVEHHTKIKFVLSQ